MSVRNQLCMTNEKHLYTDWKYRNTIYKNLLAKNTINYVSVRKVPIVESTWFTVTYSKYKKTQGRQSGHSY